MGPRSQLLVAASALLVCTTTLLAPVPGSAWGVARAAPSAAEAAPPDIGRVGREAGGDAVAETEALLSQVRKAVGRDALRERTGTIEALGRTSLGGLDGRYSLQFSGDGRAIQRIDGEIDLVTAHDGRQVWTTDLGGESRVLDDSDREAQLLGLEVFTNDWLASDPMLRVRLDPTLSDAQKAVLRFEPVNGRVVGTIEIDRLTGLPTVWTYAIAVSADHLESAHSSEKPSSTISLSNWIDHEGCRVPGDVVIASDAGAAIRIEIEELKSAPPWSETAFDMPPQPPTDAHFDPAVPAAIEVVRSPTGHLLVHPRVNGQDVGWFIFDTGAGMNVLTTQVAEALAADAGAVIFGEVPATGIGGTTPSKFCRPRSIALGPVTVSDPLAVILDLSFLDQPMGRRIAGLIGHNFLARLATTLDLETPAISLHDPRTLDDDALTWQPLVISKRLPHVRASFGLPAVVAGQPERVHSGLFRLDTGAAQMTVTMHEPAVRVLNLLQGLPSTDGRTGGVGGTVAVKRAELAWFELGGTRHPAVSAEFALEGRGALADPTALGNIGGTLLKPYVLVLDIPNGRIAFVPRTAAGGAFMRLGE